jgi:hypothetical protein
MTAARPGKPDSAVDEALTPLTLWSVGFDFFELCFPAPNRPHGNGSFQYEGLGWARERIEHAPEVRMPYPDVEVEVVLTIAFFWRIGGFGPSILPGNDRN